MYIQRAMEKTLLGLAKEYPVIMVCGARQVGKSTLLNHIKEAKRKYISLDDLNARKLAQDDPTLFIQTYPAPVIIDEFQWAPNLLSVIKLEVDKVALEGNDNNAMFWLTGSQQFNMLKNVSESLAGRVGILDLSTLSKSEIESRDVSVFHPSLDVLKNRAINGIKKDIHQIYEMIFRGGMPKIISSAVNKETYYENYVRTYIERDIQQLSQVGDASAFYNFMVYIAARTAQEVDYTTVSKAIGVTSPTIKRWISILSSSGLVHLLQPFSSVLSDRLVKRPKLYFMDTGLCTWLTKWPNSETLQNGAMDGAILETFVVSEIIKSFQNAGKRAELYYYRDKDQKEIDLIYLEGSDIYPIEIKKSVYPQNADKNFKVLEKYQLNICPGIIICMNDELIPYNRNAWYCPISIL
jgi:predicted AAA+ superfamily ATPase